MQIIGIRFRPPLAFARLGGANSPMDNYVWREDPTIHGSARNVLDPALSFDVLDDGSLLPFTPTVIRFREHGKLRPIAPFFELWATVVHGADDGSGRPPGSTDEVALTAALLTKCGGALSSLVYTVSVANRKAARRTGSESDGFAATAQARGDDFTRHELLASSPAVPDGAPLVLSTLPIPLGFFQVIRPVAVPEAAVDLDVLRLRLTPARGEVYGPPSALSAVDEATRRSFEIVTPANRILNPAASWLRHRLAERDPQPSDTYDGADLGEQQSWGVVDDTCDGTITANLVIRGRTLSAMSRICVGPPDFAPDRRPFISLADDLADRDLGPVGAAQTAEEDTEAQHRLADLFQRIWETASMTNLDAIRARAIGDNRRNFPPHQSPPKTDRLSMRWPQDQPYASDNVRALGAGDPSPGELFFTRFVALAHVRLADEDALVDFFLQQAARVRQMVRPAYGAFHQLSETVRAEQDPEPDFRDPRINRDRMHDMRMPPYMRDEIFTALGLTRRQYEDIIGYLDGIAARGAAPADADAPALEALGGPSDGAAVSTPRRRAVDERLRLIGDQTP
jgi:hypothetical protein